jgi:hypothetical protein
MDRDRHDRNTCRQTRQWERLLIGSTEFLRTGQENGVPLLPAKAPFHPVGFVYLGVMVLTWAGELAVDEARARRGVAAGLRAVAADRQPDPDRASFARNAAKPQQPALELEILAHAADPHCLAVTLRRSSDGLEGGAHPPGQLALTTAAYSREPRAGPREGLGDFLQFADTDAPRWESADPRGIPICFRTGSSIPLCFFNSLILWWARLGLNQ